MGGGDIAVSANSWSGTKTLKCTGKIMKTDILIGAYTLKTKGKLATADISIIYTPDSVVNYDNKITVVGTSTFTVPAGYNRIQFFAVGGGGGTGSHATSSSKYFIAEGGGGGGYTALSTEYTTTPGTKYSIIIGAGGKYTDGGTTSVSLNSTILVSAAGGKKANDELCGVGYYWVTAGGDGGSGGGGGYANHDEYISYQSGGSNGGNGAKSDACAWDSSTSTSGNYFGYAGKGQGSSTIFNGVTYAGGGGGGIAYKGESPKAAFSVGGDGGGGGGGIRYDTNMKYVYRKPISGTAGTGGGCGGSTASYYDDGGDEKNTGVYDVYGGSGVVVVKLWEV